MHTTQDEQPPAAEGLLSEELLHALRSEVQAAFAQHGPSVQEYYTPEQRQTNVGIVMSLMVCGEPLLLQRIAKLRVELEEVREKIANPILPEGALYGFRIPPIMLVQMGRDQQRLFEGQAQRIQNEIATLEEILVVRRLAATVATFLYRLADPGAFSAEQVEALMRYVHSAIVADGRHNGEEPGPGGLAVEIARRYLPGGSGDAQ